MKSYTPETESVMRRYYLSLILRCSKRTVRKGAAEVSGLPMRAVNEKIGKLPSEPVRIRKTGRGRKPYWILNPEIDDQFLSVLRDHTAGDPMDEKVRWTNLREREIVKALQNDHEIKVSRNIVRQLLIKQGYRLRKAQKRKPRKKSILATFIGKAVSIRWRN